MREPFLRLSTADAAVLYSTRKTFGFHDRSSLVLVVALLSALGLGCGGDGSSTTTNPDAGGSVATVQISGQPTGPTLVGSKVQLVATPLNASGAVMSNQRVTWTSSDQALASVTTGGLVTALRAGVATVTATSGQATGTVTLDLRGGGSVGSEGGTLALLDNAVTVTIPSGALAQTTVLLARPLVGGLIDPRMVGASAFELGPETLNLFRAGTLTIGYDTKRLAAGTVESSLQLYTLSNGAWLPVRGSTVDLAAHTVSGPFFRAGMYAVVSTPVNRVTIQGPLASGALYVGQSSSLAGVSFDANGDELKGRTLTWTSSNASIARVDSAGLVTATGAGSATITAAADGKSATMVVPVLPPPTASWSQSSEWSTFQGDARHTGAISATLDPRTFRQLWTGAGMRGPVTLGAGKVYGTTGTTLVALDARTGTRQWTYDMGARDSYDPPAFGNGTVYLQTGGHSNSFVWAVSAADGSLRWRSPYGNQWSSWYAPVIEGQSVYVAAGYYGGMSAFDANSGASTWSVSLNQYDLWTPGVAGGQVYAYTGDYSPKLTVVDAATGKVSFEIPDPHFSWRGWSMNLAPVLGTQNDVIAQPDNRLVSFDLGTRSIRWEVSGWVSPWGGAWQATVSNGVIYGFNNTQVEARSEADGSLQWAWPLPDNGTAVGTMIATSNLLFVSATVSGSSTGVTYALDLASHRKVWSYPASGQLAISAGGVLYIANSNSLTAIAIR